MKLAAPTDPISAPSGPAPTIFEAIVRKLCVLATYNRTRVILAPHAIYTRHGDLFVDAITMALNGVPPREAKLGTFKLAGLNDLERTIRHFEVSALFDAGDPKYADELLLAAERG